VLPADARMTGRLSLGYRHARAACSSVLAEQGQAVAGHEFHYSAVDPPAGALPAWLLDDRRSGASRPEGFVAGGVHASYLHTHWAGQPELPGRLVAAARAAVPVGTAP
jgi:cobyrinic acid a,c-diamide synthase